MFTLSAMNSDFELLREMTESEYETYTRLLAEAERVAEELAYLKAKISARI